MNKAAAVAFVLFPEFFIFFSPLGFNTLYRVSPPFLVCSQFKTFHIHLFSSDSNALCRNACAITANRS
jgi:hypothetical protein